MAIEITERALTEFNKLGLQPGQYLRINVVPGGCAGMTYNAAIDDQRSPEDETLFSADTLEVISDSGNAIFLEGLEIDYSDDLIKSGFRFANPNASGSCGCGSSFAG